MRKLLLLLAAALALASPAHAQKTKAAITTEINTLFADNTSGQITPAKLRLVTQDIVNSYVDWLTCTGTGGLVYWSAGTPTCVSAGTAGQVLKTNGGTLAPSWADVSATLVAGTGITITGTSPATISITNQLVAGGPTGSATVTPIITYNAQGQLTAVSSATIAPPFSAVTGTAQVTQGGTGLTGGTSGGVPFFDSPSTMASSAALLANRIVLGGGAGAAPATLGSLGTTTTVLHGNAAGAPSFGAVVSADLNITPTTCTNQFLSAISATVGGTCTAFSLTGAQFANQGTTTTVLHGNAAGNPTFGAVALGTDVSGTLGLTNGGFGGSITANNGGVLYSDASRIQLLAGTVTAGQCLLSGSSAAPSWGSCAGGASVTSIAGNTGAFTLSTGITNSVNDIRLDKATSANLEAGTSNKALTADIIYDGEVTLTHAGTMTWDFSTFLNAVQTLTSNVTSLTCSNIKASQSGVITLIQDATGSRTMVSTWCSQFRWANGSRGVLSTAASSVDALFYQCRTSSICYVSLGKAQAN